METTKKYLKFEEDNSDTVTHSLEMFFTKSFTKNKFDMITHSASHKRSLKNV